MDHSPRHAALSRAISPLAFRASSARRSASAGWAADRSRRTAGNEEASRLLAGRPAHDLPEQRISGIAAALDFLRCQVGRVA